MQEGGGLDAETIRQARAQQPSSGSIPVVVAGGDAAAVRDGGADGVAVRFDQLAPAAAALSGRPADTLAEQARLLHWCNRSQACQKWACHKGRPNMRGHCSSDTWHFSLCRFAADISSYEVSLVCQDSVTLSCRFRGSLVCSDPKILKLASATGGRHPRGAWRRQRASQQG